MQKWQMEIFYAPLLKSAKKLAKIEIFCKIQFNGKSMQRIMSKKWWNIHFWKALDHAISNMQKVLQNFKQTDVKLGNLITCK